LEKKKKKKGEGEEKAEIDMKRKEGKDENIRGEDGYQQTIIWLAQVKSFDLSSLL